MKKDLTEKQKVFVKEYQIDFNATAAAKRAGYGHKNADKVGSKLIGNCRVYEAISLQVGERLKKIEIKADNILQELAKIAFCTVTDFFEMNDRDQFKLKPLTQLNPSSLGAIKSITSGVNGYNIQFYDKLTALKALGDYLNMWSGENSNRLELDEEAQKESTKRMLDIINKRIERQKRVSENTPL